jgi:hypothetical protein
MLTHAKRLLRLHDQAPPDVRYTLSFRANAKLSQNPASCPPQVFHAASLLLTGRKAKPGEAGSSKTAAITMGCPRLPPKGAWWCMHTLTVVWVVSEMMMMMTVSLTRMMICLSWQLPVDNLSGAVATGSVRSFSKKGEGLALPLLSQNLHADSGATLLISAEYRILDSEV